MSAETGEDAPLSPASVADGGFPERDLIVTAICTPANAADPGMVTVDGWDPESWKRLAHAKFPLPPNAVGAGGPDDTHASHALSDLCEEDTITPPDAGNVTRLRSLFDQDFTKMAVVTEDPQSGASHVGYVDRSGTFTDLTGDKGFGNTPQEDTATFWPDGSAVWFVSMEEGRPNPYRVASRSVTGDHKAVVHGEGEDWEYLTVVRNPSRVVRTGDDAHVSPNGERLLAGNRVMAVPADAELVDVLEEPGAEQGICPDATAVGWIDDDTVLCGTNDYNFRTLDLSAGAKPSAPILPENDHVNRGMVISPDGQRFAFLSQEGTSRDFYLSSTKPKSTPTKVEKTGSLSALSGTAVVLEWR
ncbi:hypothetical protein ACFQ0B_48095 [Nonomuraea thailandensis]